MKPWKLHRTKQCSKCPWKVSTNPHDIPDGYDPELHAALENTIAKPGQINTSLGVAMACHESKTKAEDMCLGWLVNQVGPGNNIALRLYMARCENAEEIELDGEQHDCFENTLP